MHLESAHKNIKAAEKHLRDAYVRTFGKTRASAIEYLDRALAAIASARGEIAPETLPAEVQIVRSAASRFFQISPAELCSTIRTNRVAQARQQAMVICRRNTNGSLAQIGSAFGGRDHSTVTHAMAAHAARMDTDRVYADRFAAFERECANALGDARQKSALAA